MYLSEVEELLDYLNYHPSSQEIMAARYEIKIGKFKLREKEFMHEFDQLTGTKGLDTSSVSSDEEFMSNMDFAKSMFEKMGKKPN